MMKKAKLITTASFLFVAMSIPFSVQLLLRGYQFPRAQEAESPVSFSPPGGTQRAGEPFIVQVKLNTGGQAIDGLDLLIHGVNLDISGRPVKLPSSLSYQYGPENVLNRVLTSMLANPTTGFRNDSGQTILELSVKGVASCAESRLTFDPQFSVVASQGKNIIGSPEDAVFNIETPPGVLNPEFTSPAEAEAEIGQLFVYRAETTNPNNTFLNFQYSGLPDWLVANGPEIRGIPDRTGTFSVGITVADNRGGSACANLIIKVNDPSPLAVTDIRVEPIAFDSASVNWKTNRPATSIVEYGETNTYDHIETLYDLDQNHSLTLHDLSPLTTYYFRIKSEEPEGGETAVSDDQVFATPPKPATDLILKINLKMEGKRPNDNDHPVTISKRDRSWSQTFTPMGDGYYPLALNESLLTDGSIDLLLKGYQHLQVKRTAVFPPGSGEISLDFGLLPTGDIAPRSLPDNFINTLDYSVLVSEIRPEVSDKESIADLNSDWVVNSIDYSLMVNNFNREGES
jgi:hypothetical protein